MFVELYFLKNRSTSPKLLKCCLWGWIEAPCNHFHFCRACNGFCFTPDIAGFVSLLEVCQYYWSLHWICLVVQIFFYFSVLFSIVVIISFVWFLLGLLCSGSPRWELHSCKALVAVDSLLGLAFLSILLCCLHCHSVHCLTAALQLLLIFSLVHELFRNVSHSFKQLNIFPLFSHIDFYFEPIWLQSKSVWF